MCCSQRHVLRHGWHFPSWPKVLLAHCSQLGLGAGTAGRGAGRAATKLRLSVLGLASRAGGRDSTNMELSVACLTCKYKPSPSCSESSSQTSSSDLCSKPTFP